MGLQDGVGVNPRGRGSYEGYKLFEEWIVLCKGGREKEICKAKESLWVEKD